MWIGLSLLATASAVEIGTTKMVGVGVHTGMPSSVTGKIWTNDRLGYVAHIDYHPFLRMGGLRLGTEYGLARFGEWDFGAVDLTVNGAAAFQAGAGWIGSTVVRVGGGGGLGVALLLKDAPVEIYQQTQLMLYPMSLAGGDFWLPGVVSLGVGLGARYYF